MQFFLFLIKSDLESDAYLQSLNLIKTPSNMCFASKLLSIIYLFHCLVFNYFFSSNKTLHFSYVAVHLPSLSVIIFEEKRTNN